MTAIITILNLGEDVGPFNLFSNTDGFISAFAVNITREQLLNGYFSESIPDGTFIVRVVSLGICENMLEIELAGELCFKFFPLAGYYFLDSIYKDGFTYLYGNFTAYQNGIESDIVSRGYLIKLNADLTVDKTFVADPGLNQAFFDGSYIKEDYLGRLIVSGTHTSYNGTPGNRLVRINTDGSIDNTFNIGTGFNNFTQAIGFFSNNTIIIGGIFSQYQGAASPRIAKLLENGDVDPSFIIGTGFNNTVTDILMNADDSFFAVGYFASWKGVATAPGITKLLPNGDRDFSFDGGTGFNPFLPNNPNNILRLPGEENFYVLGYFTTYKGIAHNRIIKLFPNGDIDGSFNAGTGFNNVVSISEIIWGDKLFVTGLFTEYNGTPSFYSIILNPDGSIYLPFSFDSYYQPFVIDNKLYGPIGGDCIQLIYEDTTTTTTTAGP